MYVIFSLSIINISLVYISINLPRIVVRGDVYFVVLKGSPNNFAISSCCTNLFSAYSRFALSTILLVPKASPVNSPYAKVFSESCSPVLVTKEPKAVVIKLLPELTFVIEESQL